MKITAGGRTVAFPEGRTVTVGRSPNSDVVIEDPAVSGLHARVSYTPAGWLWVDVGQSRTYLHEHPMSNIMIDEPTELTVGSIGGPRILIEPMAENVGAPPPAAPAPGTNPPAPAPPAPVPSAPVPSAPVPSAPVAPVPAPPPPAPEWNPPPTPGWNAPPEPGWNTPYAYPAPGEQPTHSPWTPNRPHHSTALDYGKAFDILLPLKSWFTDRGWGQLIRLAFIPYALLPVIYLVAFAKSTDLATPGWAYSLYVAPLWLVGFWFLFRPGPIRKLEVVCGAGIVAWVVVWLKVVTVNINDAIIHHSPTQTFQTSNGEVVVHQPNLLGFIGVGYNEELSKMLPVFLAGLVLLKVREQKLSPRMWMLLGTLSGVTFGVVEQAIYNTRYLNSLIGSVLQPQGSTQQQALNYIDNQIVQDILAFCERVFVDGFQHAMWAGISAFFVGLALNYRRRRPLLLAFGLTLPALLHAANDNWAGTHAVWIFLQALSLFLLIGYSMSADKIERQVRKSSMFRGGSIVLDPMTNVVGGPST